MNALTVSAKLIHEVFNWRVALDLLLITAGIFFLHRTLLRLGTWKIVAGIVLAMAIFVAANVLDLKGIGWIYTNLSQVAAIALIVIFQPELRKVFARAASLRRYEKNGGSSDLSLLIADAAFALAQRRRGAILVFPGKEPIREWLSGGTSLNADPSFSLIMSIFDPNSPGHDGALLIENGKLTHFGVRLPGSKTDSLPQEMGTRHHAAMGLSEVADALVLVVSEERGSVTIFQAGKLERAYHKSQVAHKIATHWEKTASYGMDLYRERKMGRFVSEIASSLVLALLFWSTVVISQGEIREKGFVVPIEYTSIPQHLALVGEKPTEIKLYLTGPKSDLSGMDPSQLSVKVDLSGAMAGRQLFIVSEENITLPRGVKLLDAEPSTLSLSLEEIVEHQIPVQPQLIGTLPQGLELESVEVSPKRVTVLAAARGVKEKITLMTTPIYLESITENARLARKIIAPPNVRPPSGRWPEVEVFITVGPRR
jgi:uncharacterized protein (TIGR00159 family)